MPAVMPRLPTLRGARKLLRSIRQEPRRAVVVIANGGAATPCLTLHHDGTVTYFDDYLQTWVQRAPFVPAHVTIPAYERDRLARRQSVI